MKIDINSKLTIASYDFPAPDSWTFPFLFYTDINEKKLSVKIPKNINEKLNIYYWQKAYKLSTLSKYTLEDIAQIVGLSKSAISKAKVGRIIEFNEDGKNTAQILAIESNVTTTQVTNIVKLNNQRNTNGDIANKIKPEIIKDIIKNIGKLKTPTDKERTSLITELEKGVSIEDFQTFNQILNKSIVSKLPKTPTTAKDKKEDRLVKLIKFKLIEFNELINKIKSILTTLTPEVITELTKHQDKAYFQYDDEWKLIQEVEPNYRYIEEVLYDDKTGKIENFSYKVSMKVFTKDDIVEHPKKEDKLISVKQLLTNTRGIITTRLKRLGMNAYQKSAYLIPKWKARAPVDQNGQIVRDNCSRKILNEDLVKLSIMKAHAIPKNKENLDMMKSIFARVRKLNKRIYFGIPDPRTKSGAKIIKNYTRIQTPDIWVKNTDLTKITDYIDKKNPKLASKSADIVKMSVAELQIEFKEFTWEEICKCELAPVYEKVISFLFIDTEKEPFKPGEYAWDFVRSNILLIASVPFMEKGVEWVLAQNKTNPGKLVQEKVATKNLKKPKKKYIVDDGRYLKKIGDFEDWLAFANIIPEDKTSVHSLVKIISKGMSFKGSSFHKILEEIKEAEDKYAIPKTNPNYEILNPNLLKKRITTILFKYERALETYPFASFEDDPSKVSKGWYYSRLEKLPPVTDPNVKLAVESDELIDIRKKIETKANALKEIVNELKTELLKRASQKKVKHSKAKKPSKVTSKFPSSMLAEIRQKIDSMTIPTDDDKRGLKTLLEEEIRIKDDFVTEMREKWGKSKDKKIITEIQQLVKEYREKLAEIGGTEEEGEYSFEVKLGTKEAKPKKTSKAKKKKTSKKGKKKIN